MTWDEFSAEEKLNVVSTDCEIIYEITQNLESEAPETVEELLKKIGDLQRHIQDVKKKIKIDAKPEYSKTQIYTTGAFLRACELAPGKWGWVVEGFEDGSYMDGEDVDPREFADTEEGLFAGLEFMTQNADVAKICREIEDE
jgi:hypothetical protein